MTKRTGIFWAAVLVASGLIASAASAFAQWEKPTTTLAAQIAEILGPGQAKLTVRNLSTIPNDEIPIIQRLIQKDLKKLGIVSSGAESANIVRITLSEDQRERLWVAEVIEGNETRVTMVQAELPTAHSIPPVNGIALHKQSVLITGDEVLAVLEMADTLVAVEPEEIVIYGKPTVSWQEQKRVKIGQKKPLVRDSRGVIVATPNGDGFEASIQLALDFGAWTVSCKESDAPWPILQSVAPTHSLGANYNAIRNYFTGAITPSIGADLPPFYAAALFSRSSDGAALLIGGTDGKLQIMENGKLKPVNGARDWGSDFGALHSGCGEGWQILASSSGDAVSDSLRAYELPAQEAIPVSAPLAMNGAVTALWSAPDGKSIFAVVRKNTDQNSAYQYEVDRVTATCN
jgi:hypothetical protein